MHHSSSCPYQNQPCQHLEQETTTLEGARRHLSHEQ
jgi:hypothetical protein